MHPEAAIGWCTDVGACHVSIGDENITPLERRPAPWPVKSKALSQPSAGGGHRWLRSRRSCRRCLQPMTERLWCRRGRHFAAAALEVAVARRRTQPSPGARKPRSPFESGLPEGQTPRDDIVGHHFGAKNSMFFHAAISNCSSREREGG